MILEQIIKKLRKPLVGVILEGLILSSGCSPNVACEPLTKIGTVDIDGDEINESIIMSCERTTYADVVNKYAFIIENSKGYQKRIPTLYHPDHYMINPKIVYFNNGKLPDLAFQDCLVLPHILPQSGDNIYEYCTNIQLKNDGKGNFFTNDGGL